MNKAINKQSTMQAQIKNVKAKMLQSRPTSSNLAMMIALGKEINVHFNAKEQCYNIFNTAISERIIISADFLYHERYFTIEKI